MVNVLEQIKSMVGYTLLKKVLANINLPLIVKVLFDPAKVTLVVSVFNGVALVV